jgi:hypothetical protein
VEQVEKDSKDPPRNGLVDASSCRALESQVPLLCDAVSEERPSEVKREKEI